MTFVHLHNHSHYSVMDGFNTPQEIVARAVELGQPAVAVTDHGTLSAHRELQEAALAAGIKPILGLEAYISATDRFDRRKITAREDNTQVYNHIILLAKNQQGLRNLQRLSEIAWSEGYYYKPRIDFEVLERFKDGIIVLSGCMNGLIAKAFERGDMDKAHEWTQKFQKVFGDDFYMEVQAHNPPELNQFLFELCEQYGIKAVATSDSHFTREDERPAEEIMLALNTASKYRDKDYDYNSTKHLGIFEQLDTLYPERPISFAKIDVFMQSRAEVVEAFGPVGNEVCDVTLEIADKVEPYEFYKGLDLLPMPDKTDSPINLLRERVYKGLRGRRLADKPEYVARVEEELGVIQQKNFERYFLVVADVVRWAKQRGIMVGPGRGSAAGSLVCYCLRITDVDPIDEGLLFFRFINPDREDFPDIDLDFEDRRRHEVKEYLRKKYGHAASISTFGYFKDKGVVRDVSRVLAVPLDEVNEALKTVDTWEQFITSPNTKKFRERYPLVVKYADQLRGKIRNVGMHAAGIVVSKEPIERYAPIEYREDPSEYIVGRVPAVAYDMKVAQAIGLIKMDILGLKTLTVIHDALDMIEERHGPVDLADIPLDDPDVLSALARGETVGVFQCEANPYTELLKRMGCDSIQDLAASNALVRPGAMNTVGPTYLARKQGREPVDYPHALLEPYLRDTYGVIIYQEQVMQTAMHLGGLSPVEAENMRKVIGKKEDKAKLLPYKQRFIDGATKHVTKQVAEGLWHDFEAHAEYSFNKSHAVCYSRVSYWTQWLKQHYPLEFMCAVLRNEQDNDKRTEYLIECKRLGLTILLPNVERSAANFSIQNDAIRFGLGNVKYCSGKTAEKIIAARPFKTYAGLVEFASTKGSGVNSRVVGALNKVGACVYPDNPKRGDESQSFYEYLNIPAFKTVDLPAWVLDKVQTMDEFTEAGTYLVKGLVTGIKRGKGWARIELLDETGRIGVFHDEQTPLVEGQQYFMLIGANRIVKYIPVDDLAAQLDEPKSTIAKFLVKPIEGTVVLAVQERRTKQKQLMATVVFAHEDGSLTTALLWPGNFGRMYGKLKPGKRVQVQLGSTQDGTKFIKGVG